MKSCSFLLGARYTVPVRLFAWFVALVLLRTGSLQSVRRAVLLPDLAGMACRCHCFDYYGPPTSGMQTFNSNVASTPNWAHRT